MESLQNFKPDALARWKASLVWNSYLFIVMLQNTYTEKDVSVVFKEPGSLNLETAGIMPGLIVLRHSIVSTFVN